MKFTFTDKKINLPNYVHNYAEKKVGKLDRYFKEDAAAAVTFSVEKDRNKVEITVRSGSTILRVSESTSDMLASIDSAVTMLERQIRKNKTRLEKRLRQGAFERTVDEESTFVPVAEEGDYATVLATDETVFGGFGRLDKDYIYKAKKQKDGQIGFLCYLPCRTAQVFKKVD